MVGTMIHEIYMMIDEQTVWIQDIITKDRAHLTMHQTIQDHTTAGLCQDLQNVEVTGKHHQEI